MAHDIESENRREERKLSREERKIEEIRKTDPGFIPPMHPHRKQSRGSLWLWIGVGIAILLLLIWLTIAIFCGDTDVNLITPWPWL